MRTIFLRSLCFIFLSVSVSQADWVAFTNLNLAIPDNDEMGVQNTQSLNGYLNAIDTIEVSLRLSAAPADLAYNGDFYITLQHDSGFSVLLNRVGRTAGESLGYDNNGFDITFSLAASDLHLYQTFSPSYDGNGRLIGNWGADGRNVDPATVLDTDARTAGLDSFSGVNPNGNWTLFVADLNLNGNAQLDQWGLNITVIPEPATFGLLMLGCLLLLRRRS
ncbi:MAG TPA: PEP-CTERM sorting domain-containing protein [Verrucomicrobia bacterium]|nr:MAG: hypothetical protein A2X46_12795 [Lentisphaerae bacterium GWF2_57_35]HBA85553.1 PEP-CTERM sorting domain-containing protein [Verrucomicrobiota bacterium]